MGSWTEGGKETFAVSNHLTRHALLITVEVDGFYKVPTLYSVLFRLTGLTARFNRVVSMEPAILSQVPWSLLRMIPAMTVNH